MQLEVLWMHKQKFHVSETSNEVTESQNASGVF